MAFQKEATFPWRIVLDNVAFPLEIKGAAAAAAPTVLAYPLFLISVAIFATPERLERWLRRFD